MATRPISRVAPTHTGSANEAVALEFLRDFQCKARRVDEDAAGAEMELLPGQSPHNEARHVLRRSPYCKANQAFSPPLHLWGRLDGTYPIAPIIMCGCWAMLYCEILASSFDTAKKAFNFVI